MGDDPMNELQDSVVVDNRWTIGSPLRGGPDRGMYRGAGDVSVLVTMGAPQQRPRVELERLFGYSGVGIAPLLALTSVTIEGVPYDALVEGEPDGHPITERAPTDPHAFARELARIVARAHAAGQVLGGLRPELVYSDGAHCTGIAPRAEPYLTGAAERCYGVPPCFDHIYASPETLALRPTTAASDVFSLCATLAYLFDGKPPFEGGNLIEELTAAIHGAHRPMTLPAPLRAGFATDPGQRPAAAVVLAAL
jgi:hypothetical protein